MVTHSDVGHHLYILGDKKLFLGLQRLKKSSLLVVNENF
jgi:hypothetical protein